MNIYRADLHIHTVLSPCGSLEMSPANILQHASKKRLDIIGITDHNSTLNARLIQEMGNDLGITVLTGAEVTTSEEVHCLTFFDGLEMLNEFQRYIDANLLFVRNNPEMFGHQVVVDEKENILKEIDSLLIVGINRSIGEVRQKVRELGGIFIPAHVNRPGYGIYSQLGFIPDNLEPDAVEIWNQYPVENLKAEYPELGKYSLIVNSDAHTPERIGFRFNEFMLEMPTFSEIKLALAGKEGREVKIV